jgi:A/G-specific adenine glycosylase
MSTRSWFSRALAPWYRENRRDLPWRRTRDPYRIWLSEVILQQTRVDQGTAYYERFVARYPDVERLATAPDGEVMKLWQGLGYYSRARNLLATARAIANGHGGRFPETPQELLRLKGVGAYTAAAIASIAFGHPAAVVVGNVYRVLARVFGLSTPIDSTEGKRLFAALAEELMDRDHPGDHNQAVMELGATVCTPRDPSCETCPLAPRCIALKEGRIAALPVKAGRTSVRERYFHYLVIGGGRHIVLHQRTERDIWRDLYQPPLVETTGPSTRKAVAAAAAKAFGRPFELGMPSEPVKHVLSHQVIHARFWPVKRSGTGRLPTGWMKVDRAGLRTHAVPRLIDRFLQHHFAQAE